MKVGNWCLAGLLGVGAVCFGFSAVALWQELAPQHKGADYYETLGRELSGDQAVSADDGQTEPPSKEILPAISWTDEKMVAWLSLADTKLNYPVMQGVDNEYYLTHLPNDQENILGSLFLDVGNGKEFKGSLSVIHGHDAKWDNMFGVLAHYRKQEYYDAHSEMVLRTPEQDYTLKLISAYLLEAEEGYPEELATEEDFQRYLQEITERSFFKGGDMPTEPCPLVVLSTCAYDFQDARLAVVGYLLPKEQ